MTGINTDTQRLDDKNLIHTPDGNTYRKQDNNVRSIFYAGGAAAGAFVGGLVANTKCIFNLDKFKKSFTPYEMQEYSKSFSALLKDTESEDRLLDISKKSDIKVLWHDMYENIKSNKVTKFFNFQNMPQTKEHMNSVKEYLTETIAKARGIQIGSFEYTQLQDRIFEHVMRTQTTASLATFNVQNTMTNCPVYYHSINKIALNKIKHGMEGFHEFGHLINSKNPLLMANTKISRYGHLLSAIILGITLFKRPKAEGEKPEGFFDKATTFVQENAVTLTTLAEMPRLIDEANATLTGYKYAKNYLNPSQLKNMLKLNGKAFSTYLTLAGGVVGAVAAAKAVKNWLCKPEKVEG